MQISPVLQAQVLRAYMPRGTKKLDRLQAQTVKNCWKLLYKRNRRLCFFRPFLACSWMWFWSWLSYSSWPCELLSSARNTGEVVMLVLGPSTQQYRFAHTTALTKSIRLFISYGTKFWCEFICNFVKSRLIEITTFSHF